MPELPEVETVVRQLRPRLVGRTVRGLRILDPKLRQGCTPPLRGRRIAAVSRAGKQLEIRFSPRPGGRDLLWARVHLRMTGRLLHAEALPAGERRHVRARFSLDRGSLWFVDVRRFGTLRWFRGAAPPPEDGLDPTSRAFTASRLSELLDGSRQPLKPWLLRQDRLVGLGNIYASEILHRARLSPTRPVGELALSEVDRLQRATRDVLRRAIRHCGTTFSDFQDARGIEGSFQRFLAVYDREGKPCRRCRTPVERRVQQQRSTYFCSHCQR